MDKIQHAIAKARAERLANIAGGAGKAAAAEKPPVAVRALMRPSTPPAGVDAAWQALTPLQYNSKVMKRSRVVAMDGGPEARTIDMMRTRVLQQMRDNGWRRLAITSPTAGCGKSTVSLNLAMSLQRQPDMRTMLIELDLRRPSLLKSMGTSPEASFSDVLDGSAAFSAAALRYGSNLVISANKKASREAAEMLASRHIPVLLEEIEAQYDPDIVIFDTPPMLEADDMMAFARHVDCVLLVAGAESTTVKEVDICEQDLASQTNVMGVVLNKCRYMGAEYGYGYGD